MVNHNTFWHNFRQFFPQTVTKNVSNNNEIELNLYHTNTNSNKRNYSIGFFVQQINRLHFNIVTFDEKKRILRKFISVINFAHLLFSSLPVLKSETHKTLSCLTYYHSKKWFQLCNWWFSSLLLCLLECFIFLMITVWWAWSTLALLFIRTIDELKWSNKWTVSCLYTNCYLCRLRVLYDCIGTPTQFIFFLCSVQVDFFYLQTYAMSFQS